jgi:catechol 2,3-dioxygenase-like lactoylglutathione lyase family enzyme
MTVDWEMDYIGILVTDIDKGIEHYRHVGMDLLAPAELKTFCGGNDVPPLEFTHCFLQNEALRIELVQPAGKGIFNEHLVKPGEGVIYFEFRVNDLPKEKSRLVEMGIPIVASNTRLDGSDGEVIFDTRKYGNVMIALFNEPISFPVFRPSAGRWKLDHFGWVVKDTDKFAEYYQMIGFKALSPPRTMIFNFSKDLNHTQHGKKPIPAVPQETRAVQFQNKQATFLLEVNSPGHDGSMYREFLDTRGEGIDHIHFLVDDGIKELEDMAVKGFEPLSYSKNRQGKVDEAVFDTRQVGNVCISLWSGKPPFKPKPE